MLTTSLTSCAHADVLLRLCTTVEAAHEGRGNSGDSMCLSSSGADDISCSSSDSILSAAEAMVDAATSCIHRCWQANPAILTGSCRPRGSARYHHAACSARTVAAAVT